MVIPDRLHWSTSRSHLVLYVLPSEEQSGPSLSHPGEIEQLVKEVEDDNPGETIIWWLDKKNED